MKSKRRWEKSIFSKDYAIALKVLKDARRVAGVTQIELAEALGITQSAVSKIERGEVRLDVVQLRRVLFAFRVTLVQFAERFEAEVKRLR